MTEFQINPESSSLAERKEERRQKQRTQWIIIGAMAVCCVFVGLIVATQLGGSGEPAFTGGDDGARDEGRGDSVPPTEAPVDTAPQTLAGPQLVADDGQTMWASPTAGKPIDLSHLPTGCQMIVALRPAELQASAEGEKVLAALGPLGVQGANFIEKSAGLPSKYIERLLIGFRPGENFVPEAVVVVTPKEGHQPAARPEVYSPTNSGVTYVVAPPKLLEEVKQLAGHPPTLRREMESLRTATDDRRHVTIFVAPNYLFNDGRKMLSGAMAGLREPLLAILPDSTRAAALSLHWGDDFFAEVRLIASIDHRPQDFANQFAEKIASWPAAAEQAMLGLSASTYSRPVVARLPAMLRALNRYVRVGRDDDHALVRAYLPAMAGHNLLMAGELMLAEQFAGPRSAPVAGAPSESPTTLDERLQKATSLTFTRDTLETAVRLLGEDIGVEITLVGGDLQLEGITKNQSFALDENNKPAGEILVQILRLANPDKTATGPADPKQKLVYFVDQDGKAIKVSTRAATERRGEVLPSVFTE
ncbi:MAG: hypothetical protein ACR2NU_03950 [Aeoliella sp.]